MYTNAFIAWCRAPCFIYNLQMLIIPVSSHGNWLQVDNMFINKTLSTPGS